MKITRCLLVMALFANVAFGKGRTNEQTATLSYVQVDTLVNEQGNYQDYDQEKGRFNTQNNGESGQRFQHPAPNGPAQMGGNEKEEFMTHEQMTSLMVTELKLNEKQAKKIKKLNKKYASIIEGPQLSQSKNSQKDNSGIGTKGGPGGGMMGGPGGGMGGGMMGGNFGGGPGGSMGGGMMGGSPEGGPGGNMSAPEGSQQGQRPQGSGIFDDSMDISGKKTARYEKKLKSILTDSQYEGYQKIKPKFACQILVKRFLLGK